MELKELYNWYYSPGEILRSIGFYINPYKQWKNTKFKHIFAFDGDYNLYIGQYSVYHQHIDKIFDDIDKREYGFLYPRNQDRPVYSDEPDNINNYKDVIYFEFLESKNITYLNRRLKKISQRFYDYGLPSDSVILSKTVDLWSPTIGEINRNLVERPDKNLIKKQLNITSLI